MNSKHRKKLACLALASTIAVSSLAILTPSASAADLAFSEDNKYVILYDGSMVEIDKWYEDGTARTVDGKYYQASGNGKIHQMGYRDGNGNEITKEEALIRAASWYNLDCDGYTNKTLYVPVGGTVQNGSTYEDEDGNLRATEGSTILNRYGVDVTSVDSEMSAYEKEIAKAIHDNCGTNQITFDQTTQMIAEMRLLEVKQNMANIEATGYADQIKADTSQSYTVGVCTVYDLYQALLYTRPDVTAKLLELSKTPFTMYKINPTTAATRADMAYFLMQFHSQVNPDAAATAQASAMSDVQSGAWYAGAAKYCQEHELMNGVGNSQFDPEGTVTRGQLATVLYRMEGSPAVDMSENPFTDVQPNAYYATAIEWCRQNKIITGTSETTFAPDNAVTRQDMAVMFYRYNFGVLSAEKRINCISTYTEKYSDWSGVAEYAEKAVNWAGECGLLHMDSSAVARTYENLIADFTRYKFSDNYNNGSYFGISYGMAFKYVTESAGIDWGESYESYETEGKLFSRYDSYRLHEFTKQYDHTPTLDELAKDIFIGLGGGKSYQSTYAYDFSSSLGISFDASTNTVVAVC